jgi:hypothetical protein
MNAQEKINKLREELESLKNIQDSCEHIWKETVYDPDTVSVATYDHLEPHGSDPIPIYTYHNKERSRWSRTCEKCGVKEYTTKTKVVRVETEPEF